MDVQTGGSSRGIADTRQGVADIGMVSRNLKEEEQELQAFAIARDGIGVILHQDNPVESLWESCPFFAIAPGIRHKIPGLP